MALMTKCKLYLACALTNAPTEFRQMIFCLRDLLRDAGFEILEFGWRDGPRQDVNIYQFDLEERVDKVDVFVAICDYPSIGLGMELERFLGRLCYDESLIVLAFARRGMIISKIVPDALAYHDLPPAIPYETPEDIAREITAYLTKLQECESQERGETFITG